MNWSAEPVLFKGSFGARHNGGQRADQSRESPVMTDEQAGPLMAQIGKQ